MKTTIISSIIVSALALSTMNSASAENLNNKKLNPWTDCGIGNNNENNGRRSIQA